MLPAVELETEATLSDVLPEIRPEIELQLLRYRVSANDRRELLQRTLLRVMEETPTHRRDPMLSTRIFRLSEYQALAILEELPYDYRTRDVLHHAQVVVLEQVAERLLADEAGMRSIIHRVRAALDRSRMASSG